MHLVTSRIARAVGAGALVGLVVASLASRALQGFLYGVTATDVPSFAAAALVMCVASLVACIAPARRALGMDPALAMRAG